MGKGNERLWKTKGTLMRDRQKRVDLKCSLGCLLGAEAWKLPCCGLPLAGRAQCPRTRPAPSLSSLLSAENRVREHAWPPQTEWQLCKEMCNGTVCINCIFMPIVNVYHLQMLTIRNTCTSAHLCNYPISTSYGSSTLHKIMKMQLKSFSYFSSHITKKTLSHLCDFNYGSWYKMGLCFMHHSLFLHTKIKTNCLSNSSVSENTLLIGEGQRKMTGDSWQEGYGNEIHILYNHSGHSLRKKASR